MNNNLLFDFTVDKENKTVNVKRAFAAPESTVWAAWTEPELLDKWWAPMPWVAKTKSMDFKVGGRRLYAMVSPEGHEHWSVQDFTSITPKTNFAFLDGFCDNQGIINNDMPRSNWNVDFRAQKHSTLVNISIKHEKLTDLEKIIEMGFKEGFTMGLNQLDELFKTL